MLEWLGFKSVSDLLSKMVKTLGSSVLKTTGKKTTGWILNGVLGLGGPDEQDILDAVGEVEQEMQQLIGEVADLQNEIEESAKEIEMLINWDTTEEPINEPIENIKQIYKQLANLDPSDTQTATTIISRTLDGSEGVPNVIQDLTTLHGQLMPGGAGDPSNKGLYTMWVQAHGEKSVENWTGADFSPNSLLSIHGRATLSYFARMMSIQIQGMNLLVEAYHGRNDLDSASKAVADCMKNFKAQASYFQDLVEGFVMNYCVGQLSLGFLTHHDGRHINLIRAMDLFRAQVLAENTLTLRVWYAQNSGLGAFSTGLFPEYKKDVAQLQLTDTQSSKPLPCTYSVNSSPAIYPGRDREAYQAILTDNGSIDQDTINDSYGRASVARYRFEVPDQTQAAQDGRDSATYTLSPAMPNGYHYNGMLNPMTGLQPLNEDVATFYVDANNPPNASEINLTMGDTIAYGSSSSG